MSSQDQSWLKRLLVGFSSLVVMMLGAQSMGESRDIEQLQQRYTGNVEAEVIAPASQAESRVNIQGDSL